MKIAMIMPDENSEKAIANYSLKLIDNIEKSGVKIDKVRYVAGSPWTLFTQFKDLSKYDVIHMQHEYNLLGWYSLPYYLFYLYSKMFYCGKVVTTMHTALSKTEKLKGGKLKTFLRKYILYPTQNRLIGWASDKVILHAYMFKNILVNEYGVNEAKLEVIPQGIIEDTLITSKSKAKKELGLSGNVYLVIGSLVPDHGADIVLRQAKEIGKNVVITANSRAVNDRNDDRIANWLKYLKNYSHEHGLDKYVRFDISELPYSLWWKYFSAADLVLLPYKGGIGSGIYADSIAMRTPMVGSDIPYFQEAEKTTDAIIVAKNNDFATAIKKAMGNLKKMEKACDSYIKEYGLTAASKKYKHLYQSLIK